jgi:hypothetical protein
MAKFHQQLYLSVYRWSFKNFGQGKLPQFRSLFNVSFLLVIVLTNVLLLTQLVLKSRLVMPTAWSEFAIVFGAVFFLMLNHFILLNNKWFKKLNAKLEMLSHHNRNTWSVVLLVNAILASCVCLV